MNRRSFLIGSTGIAVLGAQMKRPKNILMIAVDDMRPELGCYGAAHVHTPNIDALAARGTVFTRAYCQQAVCSPSRTAVLTGLRPDTTNVWDLMTHFRGIVPDAVTLPELFKKNGYATAGLSKIFHGGLDDGQSWTIPWWRPGGPKWNSDESAEQAKKLRERLITGEWHIPGPQAPAGGRGPSWQSPDVADNELADGKTAETAIEALQALKAKPFFLAVGFLKPHLPFIAPKKYFDLYPLDKIEMPDYAEEPQGMPAIAKTNSGELRGYSDIGQEKISAEKARELVRAYYAAISYTDANIGRVLAELDRLGLREDTMVVLWGDHGWQLNSHGQWAKHTNFEKATHSTLIASTPGQKQRGVKCDALVEFVDIYPTIADASGLKVPTELEGRSFLPLLENPKRKWKTAAFSQYPRGKKVMGYTIRTARYRLTEWTSVDTKEVSARELYDYEADPKETVNHAGKPERAALVAQLSKQLQAGWRGALPPK